MVSPDRWHIGVIQKDGSHDLITDSSHPRPDQIDEIIFPISLPWSNQADLYRAPFEEVGRNKRKMGRESTYTARVEDRVPNSESGIWHISFELWEYPTGQCELVELEHSDHINYANWDSDDLLNAMSNRF